MASDLGSALDDAAQAGSAWTAERITLGTETVLEGEALAEAVRVRGETR